jgi:hypothetical protein
MANHFEIRTETLKVDRINQLQSNILANVTAIQNSVSEVNTIRETMGVEDQAVIDQKLAALNAILENIV